MDDSEFKMCPQNTTPVFIDNPAIQIFLDNEKKINNHYMQVTTKFGDFVAIPNDKMDEYDKLRETLKLENLVLVNPPLLYYLTKYHPKTDIPDIRQLCAKVWEVPFGFKVQYVDWYDGQKEKYKDDDNDDDC